MAQTRNGADSTLLVVDDEALIRVATSSHFRTRGWRVLEAAGSQEAKSMFVANRIDVMFSDVQMSADLDGVSLAYWVRKYHPKVEILLSSGTGLITDIPSWVCAQSSIFTKPYLCSMIAIRIEQLRSRSRPSPTSTPAATAYVRMNHYHH